MRQEEDDIYGYLVYRSQRAEGPFVRVNAGVSHAAPAHDGVGRYQFVDLDVRPGASYYYYLDTLTAEQAFRRPVRPRAGLGRD